MKIYSPVEVKSSEAILFVAVLTWIVASCFIPLPDVNSLGI